MKLPKGKALKAFLNTNFSCVGAVRDNKTL